MLLEYLKKSYLPGEPIIASDIEIGLSETNRRQQFKVLTDSGKLIRVESGIYCLPKLNRLGNVYIPTAEAIAEAKYISRKSQVLGYYSGYTFANQIGITTQMPYVNEIVSNETGNPVKKISVSNMKFIIRKPRTTVNANNFRILQMLDLLKDIDSYCEVSTEERNKIISNYVMTNGFTRADFDKYLPLYPDKTYKFIYETRVADVLA